MQFAVVVANTHRVDRRHEFGGEFACPVGGLGYLRMMDCEPASHPQQVAVHIATQRVGTCRGDKPALGPGDPFRGNPAFAILLEHLGREAAL